MNYLSNVAVFGGDAAITNSVNTVFGDFASGVRNVINNGSSFAGDLVVTNGTAKATGIDGASAALNAVYASTIDGDLSISSGVTNARTEFGVARGSQSYVENNSIGGNLLITAKNARAKGDTFGEGNTARVHSNSSISGNVTISFGNANVDAKYDNGAGRGNRINVGDNSIGGSVSLSSGVGRTDSPSATGNETLMYANTIAGDVLITAKTAKSRGDTLAEGNVASMYANSITSGNLSVSLGNATTDAKYEVGTARSNAINVADNSISGSVDLSLGVAKAEARYAAGNLTILDNNSVSGNVAVENKTSRATSPDELGTVRGTNVVFAGDIAGDLEITNGRGTANNGSDSLGILTQIGNFSSLTEIGGGITINDGTAKVSSATSASYDSMVEVRQTEAGNSVQYSANLGRNVVMLDDSALVGLVNIDTGTSDDLMSVTDTSFSQQIVFDGSGAFDTYTDAGGNSYNAGLPTFINVEDVAFS